MSSESTTSCIFCRIVRGEIPADIVARSAGAVAFRDLNPQAPVHLLVVPAEHLASSIDTVAADGREVWAEVMTLGVRVAADAGLHPGGFRFVVNTGHDGGQTVGHLHLHVLGGRQMRWPPG